MAQEKKGLAKENIGRAQEKTKQVLVKRRTMPPIMNLKDQLTKKTTP